MHYLPKQTVQVVLNKEAPMLLSPADPEPLPWEMAADRLPLHP
jgi:hypothetical protein